MRTHQAQACQIHQSGLPNFPPTPTGSTLAAWANDDGTFVFPLLTATESTSKARVYISCTRMACSRRRTSLKWLDSSDNHIHDLDEDVDAATAPRGAGGKQDSYREIEMD